MDTIKPQEKCQYLLDELCATMATPGRKELLQNHHKDPGINPKIGLKELKLEVVIDAETTTVQRFEGFHLLNFIYLIAPTEDDPASLEVSIDRKHLNTALANNHRTGGVESLKNLPNEESMRASYPKSILLAIAEALGTGISVFEVLRLFFQFCDEKHRPIRFLDTPEKMSEAIKDLETYIDILKNSGDFKGGNEKIFETDKPLVLKGIFDELTKASLEDIIDSQIHDWKSGRDPLSNIQSYTLHDAKARDSLRNSLTIKEFSWASIDQRSKNDLENLTKEVAQNLNGIIRVSVHAMQVSTLISLLRLKESLAGYVELDLRCPSSSSIFQFDSVNHGSLPHFMITADAGAYFAVDKLGGQFSRCLTTAAEEQWCIANQSDITKATPVVGPETTQHLQYRQLAKENRLNDYKGVAAPKQLEYAIENLNDPMFFLSPRFKALQIVKRCGLHIIEHLNENVTFGLYALRQEVSPRIIDLFTAAFAYEYRQTMKDLSQTDRYSSEGFKNRECVIRQLETVPDFKESFGTGVYANYKARKILATS